MACGNTWTQCLSRVSSATWRECFNGASGGGETFSPPSTGRGPYARGSRHSSASRGPGGNTHQELDGEQSMSEIDTTRGRVYYRERGADDGEGPRTLLIHGNVSSSAFFEPLIDLLPSGWHVLAPD